MKKEKPVFSTIGIVTNKSLNREGISLLKRVVKFLEKRKLALIYNKNATLHLKVKATRTDHIMMRADLVLTFGGDGTLIKLARHIGYKQVPILAFNLGNIGFLTEIQPHQDPLKALERILDSGRYQLDIRSMLRTTVYRGGKKVETFLGINEAVVNQGNFARLIELSAEINQCKMIRFKADGMIVSTPTGSTAHSLSAGGPIVHPKLDAIIFTPICPVALSIRPIVIPSNRQLTVTIETRRRYADNDLALTIDGQVITKLKYGDQIKFRRSARQFCLLRLNNNGYYRVLRDRLHWGD